MVTPILSLDHLTIASADLDAATAAYTLLLGSAPLFAGDANGRRCAIFDAGNVHIILTEDHRDAPGLRDACFRVDDEERLLRRLKRLGLAWEEVPGGDPLAPVRSHDARPCRRLAGPATRGLGLGFVAAAAPRREAGTSVMGLDHIVIASGSVLSTAFLLGAQLGLDLRMDRSNPAWGARLLFFRCGDLIVEVFFSLDGPETSPKAGKEDEGDRFYGLSWRVRNADAARERLAAAAFDPSPVRDGRKPGTRVFTVRERTAGVATLMLEPAKQP